MAATEAKTKPNSTDSRNKTYCPATSCPSREPAVPLCLERKSSTWRRLRCNHEQTKVPWIDDSSPARSSRPWRLKKRGCRGAMQPHFKTTSVHRGTVGLSRHVNPTPPNRGFSAVMWKNRYTRAQDFHFLEDCENRKSAHRGSQERSMSGIPKRESPRPHRGSPHGDRVYPNLPHQMRYLRYRSAVCFLDSRVQTIERMWNH